MYVFMAWLSTSEVPNSSFLMTVSLDMIKAAMVASFKSFSHLAMLVLMAYFVYAKLERFCFEAPTREGDAYT